jgi:hypothetical protein
MFSSISAYVFLLYIYVKYVDVTMQCMDPVHTIRSSPRLPPTPMPVKYKETEQKIVKMAKVLENVYVCQHLSCWKEHCFIGSRIFPKLGTFLLVFSKL